MKRCLQGTFVRQTTASEGFEAFVPFVLPPTPPLEVDLEPAEKEARRPDIRSRYSH
jgi:hypothetical protein